MKTLWSVFNLSAIAALIALALILSEKALGAELLNESASPTTNSVTRPSDHNQSLLTRGTTGASALAAPEEQRNMPATPQDKEPEVKSARGAKTPKEEPTGASSATNTNVQSDWLLSKAALKSSITGGMDPHGDSWASIRNSFQQFAHPAFVLRLFLSLSLAVACSCMIAWHPRRWRRTDQMFDPEERKAFIILGVVGAIVAELSAASPTLAFVIFGVGALLRFRTVLDNPKATGKAILVVVIGLACGMGSWTMAVFVTAFSCVLLFWLDSHVTGTMSIRLDTSRNSKALQDTVQSLLISHHCKPHSCMLSKGKKRMEILFDMPAGLDREKLETELAGKLPKNGDSRVSIHMA